MYVDGEWTQSSDHETFDVINPANERVIARVPSATANDAKRVLEVAQKAQAGWEDVPPIQRAKYLFEIADLVDENKEHLARVLTSEQGKPLYESRLEIAGTSENFRYYAEFARRIEGDVLPGDAHRQSVMILKLPLGVVVAITPWNFPSATVARKVAPALITGNTVVIKPSSTTPLSALELARLSEEAGLPKGVLNCITGGGSSIGNELVASPITQLVTMTGSTPAGQKIMQTASNHVAKLILELGGKAPLIVWHDADLPWAVKNALWARFWNNGQTCICSERMYIDEKISKKFMENFVKSAKALRIGSPTSPNTDLGPRVNKTELESGEKFVEDAVDEGGKVVLGGRRPHEPKKGFYYEPTIITDVGQESTLVQQEVFGPIVPVLEVDNFDKAIEMANDSNYGLASYVFTKDNTRIMKAMYKIKFGECYINSVGPEQLQGAHTGFRMSGLGAEGSRYGLEHYTQLKTNYVYWDDKPNIPYLFPYGRGTS